MFFWCEIYQNSWAVMIWSFLFSFLTAPTNIIYGSFLKLWYPTTIGFPTKNDHFGVFWGYHHWRKHPYGTWKWWIFTSTSSDISRSWPEALTGRNPKGVKTRAPQKYLQILPIGCHVWYIYLHLVELRVTFLGSWRKNTIVNWLGGIIPYINSKASLFVTYIWAAGKTQYNWGALWDIGIVFRSSLYRFTVFGACTYDMVINESEI